MSAPLVELKSLPPDERKSIEEHASRIPAGWNVRRLPRIRIPTIPPWTDRSEPDYTKPGEIECVEFEIKRVQLGYYPSTDGQRWRALVANGHIIVQMWPE